MITDLDAAIVSLFNATGSLTTAFPGGIHADVAPEGTAMPYMVFRYISAPSSIVYGDTNRTVANVRFSAVGIGKTATGVKMNAFMTAFDGIPLSLASGQNYFSITDGDPIPNLYAPRLGTTDEVWQWSASIKYSIRY